MIHCPQIYDDRWKSLVKEVGKNRAYVSYFRHATPENNFEIPDVGRAKQVLTPAPKAFEPVAPPSASSDLMQKILARYSEVLPGIKSDKSAAMLHDAITTGTYNHIVDPANKNSRKIFTEFTGIRLPNTIRGSKAVFKGFSLLKSQTPETPPVVQPPTQSFPQELWNYPELDARIEKVTPPSKTDTGYRSDKYWKLETALQASAGERGKYAEILFDSIPTRQEVADAIREEQEQKKIVPPIKTPPIAPVAAPAPAPKTVVKSPIANLSTEDQQRMAALKQKLMMKLGGQVNMGIDPEIITTAAQMAELYVKGGVKTFEQFAKHVHEDMPSLWERLKTILRGVWNTIAEALGLDEVSKADANDIFTRIERAAIVPSDERTAPTEAAPPAEPTVSGGGGVPALGGGGGGGIVRPGTPARSGTAGVGSGGTRPDVRGLAGGGVTYDQNYVITDADRLGVGSIKTKVADNLAAIKLVKTLQSEHRLPTQEEKSVLVRYVGWGGIKGVFNPDNKQFSKDYLELKELLTPEEYAAARASIQDAHYTSQTVIQHGIYAALKRFGFTGGNMVEGGSGTGNFIGLLPMEWRPNTIYVAYERDPLTATIAQYLYPERTTMIKNEGFQDAPLKRDFNDASVGNPPFGNKAIYDKNHKAASKLTIHNYFIAKELELLRAGGVMGKVVSRYFLDAADPTARDYISKLGEFLGAIRLPNTAFKENANTEVVTDLVFFKRVPKGTVTNDDWTKVVDYKDPNSSLSWKINKWIAEHPEMVLGEITQAAHGMYKETDLTVKPSPDQDLAADLDKAVANLPKDVYEVNSPEAEKRLTTPEFVSDVPDDIKVGSFFVDKGRVLQRMPDLNAKRSGQVVEMKEATADRIKAIIPVRDALNKLVKAELDNDTTDAVIEFERAKLNKVYDSFVKKYGYLNSLGNRRAFYDDTEATRILGLERDYQSGISAATAKIKGVDPVPPKATKADIFTKRVNAPYREVTAVDTPKEALSVSLNQRGAVDMDYMATLTGKNHAELVKELGDLIFQVPEGGFQSKEQYLSGNVREKLKHAEEVVSQGATDWVKNVEALKAVIPADIAAADIIAPIGAPWIPAGDVSRFATELTGTEPRTVLFLKANAGWAFEHNGRTTVETQKWGTPRVPFGDMFFTLLNGKPVIVYDRVDTDDGEKRVVNQQETELANAKVAELKDKWQEWVWSDRERRERLARVYNDTYNNYVDFKADGSHLTLPGASTVIELNPHQKNVAWRTVINGGEGLLFDQVVGSGKTFASIAGMMELRRLGRVRKWLIAVPNHLTGQWLDQFNTLYPNANIIAAKPSDFTKDNRQKLFSKVLTGDYDGVVLGHSSLKKIGTSPAVEKEILQEILDEIIDTVKQMKEAAGKGRGTRQMAAMEKTQDTIKAKIAKLADISGRDTVAGFEELGFDGLVVDEAHEFKNLFYTTQMQNVAGMGVPTGSAKAFDLYLKTRFLRKQYGGKAPIIFLTGTPISNSLVEMFTMQRYLQPQVLADMGLKTLDAWAKVFADIKPVYEVDPTGTGYRMATRLANFQNVGELTAIYRNMADVITMNDLQAQAEARNKRFPVPKVTGGKPKIFVADRTQEQAAYFGVETQVLDDDGKPQFDTEGNPVMNYPEGTILYRVDNMPDDPRVDNMLKLTNDARKAGLDMRLIHPGAADRPTSKINVAVGEITSIYRKWNLKKGTQLVFCDLSVPASAKGRATSMAKTVGVLDIDSTPQAEKTVVADDADDTGTEQGVSIDELLADQSSFSVYDDMKAKLIKGGIPANEIAFIHDYDTPEKKQKLFKQVNAGDIRVLFGSTAKMGAGTNVQKRIVALHHMDAPWRPSDLEQREGRAIRQGNDFYEDAISNYPVPQDYDKDVNAFSVAINRYATALTYDTRMWQLIEHKANGIEGFRKADRTTRKIEDVGGEAANASDMKAAASGDPLIQQELQLRNDANKLALLKKAWDRNRFELQSREAFLSDYEQRYQSRVDELNKRKAILDANTPVDDKGNRVFKFTMPDGRTADEKGVPLAYVADMIKEKQRGYFGKYRGFDFSFEPIVRRVGDQDLPRVTFLIGKNDFKFGNNVTTFFGEEKLTGVGLFQRFDNYLDVSDEDYASAAARRDKDKAALDDVKSEVAKPFSKQEELTATRSQHEAVRTQLMDKRRKKVAQQNPNAAAADELAKKLDDLKTGIGGGDQLHAFGILADLWDRAVSIAQAVIRAGGRVADAIEAAIRYIRANHKGAFDEAGARDEMERTLGSTETSETGEKRAQVAGMAEAGQMRPTENIEATTSQIRDTLFDGTQAVSRDATDKAWNILTEMTDPTTKSGRAAQIKNDLGDSRIGLTLYKAEIGRYAFKLAASGDPSLFRAWLDHSEDFETLAGGGASTAGSALRGELEFANQPAIKSLSDIFENERIRAALKGAKVDQETLLDLIRQLSDLKLSAADVESVVATGRTEDGQSIEDLLGLREEIKATRARRAKQMVSEDAEAIAKRYLERYQIKHADVEWLKQPSKRSLVAQIIADTLKSEAPVDVNPAPVIADITEKLVAAGVEDDTAGKLAHKIEVERRTTFANRRTELMNRAANSTRLSSLIESLISSPYRAQADPQWVHDTSVRWFESNGLSKEQAQAATRLFEKQFNAALQAAREKIGNAMLAKAGEPTTTDIMKLISLGHDWLDKLAEKNGWTKPTPEQFSALADLQEKLSHPDKYSPPERADITERMAGILRHLGNHDQAWARVVGESMAASLLSGMRTIDLHLFQPIETILVKIFPTLISRPQDIPTLARQLLQAAKNFFPEFRFAWQKDAFTFAESKLIGHHNELKRQFEIGVADWQNGNYLGALRLIYAWQQYVFRALQSANQASMAVTREFLLSFYGSQAMRDAGFGTQQIAELVHFTASEKSAAESDGLMSGLDPLTARVRADYVTAEQLRAFFANAVGETEAARIAFNAEADAYSMTGFKKPGIKESDEGFLTKFFLLDKLMKVAQEAREEGGLKAVFGLSAFGFINVPLRIARFNANFFGYGFFRWGVYKYRQSRGLDTPWKQSFANEDQARQRLREAIVGTTIGLGFLGWALAGNTSADDNRKRKFFIVVTGHGAKNATLRDAWLKEGYRPYSIIIGLNGSVIKNIPITRVGGALAWPLGLSAAHDDVAWAKKDAEANGRPFNDGVGTELAEMAGTYYNIIGAQGIFQGLSHFQQLSEGGGGMAKILASAVSGAVSAVLIPGKQLLAGVSQMIWGNPDRSSISAAIAANFPIIGAPWLHPQINRLGDPLGDNSWYGKLANLNLPIEFRISDTYPNQPLYQMMLDKGVAPPNLSRTELEQKYGSLTDAQFAQFAKISGTSIKNALVSNLPTLQAESPEASKSFVVKAATQADAEAATQLGLIRQVNNGRLSANEFAGTTPARAPRTRPQQVVRHTATPHVHRPKPKFTKIGHLAQGKVHALHTRRGSLFGTHRKRHIYS
jgi:N12 class adenine-specific DNA methylase